LLIGTPQLVEAYASYGYPTGKIKLIFGKLSFAWGKQDDAAMSDANRDLAALQENNS